MRGLRLLVLLLALAAAGSGAALALAASAGHHAAHRPSRHRSHRRGAKRCFASRHRRRVAVRCPKPKRRVATHRTTTTTQTRTSTTSSPAPVSTSTTTTTTTTSSTVDYCTQYGLPHRTEVDESDQGDAGYVLAPACSHLASGSDQFTVYNFDSQTHNFSVRNGAGQAQTLTFAGGSSGSTLTLDPAAAGSSTSKTATVGLPPGTYTLLCTLHPRMQATITVG